MLMAVVVVITNWLLPSEKKEVVVGFDIDSVRLACLDTFAMQNM